MAAKQVAPTLGAESFNCPHCGALAHQTWFKVFLDRYETNGAPNVPDPDLPKKIRADPTLNDHEGARERIAAHFERVLKKRPFINDKFGNYYGERGLVSCDVGQCFSCRELTIWVFDELLYPAHSFVIEPNADLPGDIRPDFEEAARIVNLSPRGAAALLRLCVQKICISLGEKGKTIDEAIAALVAKGLSTKIQKALDIVRVIGNEAVHPGQIDFRDDKNVAMELFGLVNLVTDAMITQPKN